MDIGTVANLPAARLNVCAGACLLFLSELETKDILAGTAKPDQCADALSKSGSLGCMVDGADLHCGNVASIAKVSGRPGRFLPRQPADLARALIQCAAYLIVSRVWCRDIQPADLSAFRWLVLLCQPAVGLDTKTICARRGSVEMVQRIHRRISTAAFRHCRCFLNPDSL